MSTKVCFKCQINKSLSEFYVHKEMADGHLNKCKSCTKNDTKERSNALSSDPEWINSERKRGREKYYRLGYKGKLKPEAQKKYKEKYPEKYKAKCSMGMIKSKTKGNHLHHWSYNEEHYKDVIELTPKEHSKAHRFIVYDQERMMYRTFDNNLLLDTRETHEKFIKNCITYFQD